MEPGKGFDVKSQEDDYDRDMSLLHLDPADMRKLCDGTKMNGSRMKTPVIGDEVFMVHVGASGSLTIPGVVTGIHSVIDEDGRHLVLAAATYQSKFGNSGAGVYCAKSGKLVGMHLKGGSKYGTSNYFTPVQSDWPEFLHNKAKLKSNLPLVEQSKNSFLAASSGSKASGGL